MPRLPSAIEAVESPGEVRYRLPPRAPGPLRYVGLVPMAMGAFIASWPLLAVVFFLSAEPPLEGGALLFVTVGPLACFGPFCFPIGGFFLVRGLFLYAGHTEVAVRGGRLLRTDRCGPLRWTRRWPLHALRGFRVEYGQGPLPVAPLVPAQDAWSNLQADLPRGRSVMLCEGYPRPWLLALAQELAGRCGGAADHPPPDAEAVAVAEESRDPNVIERRPAQPTNSTAVLGRQADGLTIHFPPPGLLRGSGWFFLLWSAVWNGFVLLFAVGALSAVFFGEAKWEGTDERVSGVAVCLFLTPFMLIGVGCSLGILHRGRRSALVVVSGGALQVMETGLFGSRWQEWPAGTVAGVRVVSESITDGDGDTVWTVALGVQPREGKTARLFPDRAKPELEWVATVVRQALGLPAGDGPEGR